MPFPISGDPTRNLAPPKPPPAFSEMPTVPIASPRNRFPRNVRKMANGVNFRARGFTVPLYRPLPVVRPDLSFLDDPSYPPAPSLPGVKDPNVEPIISYPSDGSIRYLGPPVKPLPSVTQTPMSTWIVLAAVVGAFLLFGGKS